MKYIATKSLLTPWGEMVEGQEVKAEGAKLEAMLKFGFIKPEEAPKAKIKEKSKAKG